MAGANWRTVVLEVVRDVESKYKPGTRYQTRIVQKIKDGKHMAIKVEVGETYIKAATGEPAFKTTGMTVKDVEALASLLPRLRDLVNNPPPVPPEEMAAADSVDF